VSAADFARYEEQQESARLRAVLEEAHEKASEIYVNACGGDAGRLRTLMTIITKGLKGNG
jgi:hypothetical protein